MKRLLIGIVLFSVLGACHFDSIVTIKVYGNASATSPASQSNFLQDFLRKV